MKKIIALMMALLMVFSLAACGGNGTTTAQGSGSSSDVTVMGEGKTSFNFTVPDLEGNEPKFEIHTDEKTVGAALLGVGLIAGEDSDFGLYVTTVNGVTLDWDKDGKYWAFYVNGEYATTGVDSTDVTAGETYSFVAE